MVKLFAFVLMTVVIFCSCSGYTGEVDSVPHQEVSSITEVVSQDPSLPEASAVSEPVVPAMSYEEYFSEIRKYSGIEKSEQYKDILFFTNNKNDYEFLYNESIGENFLCRMGLYSDKYEVIIPQDISDFCFYLNDTLLCIINQTQIVMTDMDGNQLKILYEADNPLSYLFASNELVFFMSNNTIYRIYVPTMTVDEICRNDEMIRFEPVSNVEVIWEKDNPEWINYFNETQDFVNKPNIPDTIEFYHNAMTGENYQRPFTYWSGE